MLAIVGSVVLSAAIAADPVFVVVVDSILWSLHCKTTPSVGCGIVITLTWQPLMPDIASYAGATTTF